MANVAFLIDKALKIQEAPINQQQIQDFQEEVEHKVGLDEEQKNFILEIISGAWENLGNETDTFGFEWVDLSKPSGAQERPLQVLQSESTESNEPPLEIISRVFQVFIEYIKYSITFVLSSILCLPAPPTPKVPQICPSPPPVLIPERRPSQQQDLPDQIERPIQENQEDGLDSIAEPIVMPKDIEEGVYKGTTHIALNEPREKMCYAFSMLETFWDLIQRNIAPERYPHYIDKAVNEGRSKNAEQGELEELFTKVQGSASLGVSTYEEMIHRLLFKASHENGISAALLEKEGQIHLLIANVKDRRTSVYYHTNLQESPLEIKIYKTEARFIQYLNEEFLIPEPLVFTIYSVRDLE